MKTLHALLAGILLTGAAVPAQADCMRDREGRVVCDRGQCERNSRGWVYCAAYEDGTAMKDRFGEVVCGKGECVTTLEGQIICSARPGGAAMKDSLGNVTCEGDCEDASVELCGARSEEAR